MLAINQHDFPKQKIATSQKNKEWAAKCCDWIINQGINCKDADKLIKMHNMVHGIVPDEFYKKILNPYNATEEKYKRFPATLRNYDLIGGILRRYVGEYSKNPHIFIVGANNPEVVLNRDMRLRQEIAKLLESAIAAEIQRSYQEWINQGQDPQQFNPQEQIDIEAFSAEFKKNYIDDISAQGAEVLDVIKDMTDDALFYINAYSNYVTYGETYTYTDVIGTKLKKEVINPIDAFPIPTDNMFVEDCDMFARRRKMSYSEIIDEFDEYFTDKDRDFINEYYAQDSITGRVKDIPFSVFNNYYGDVCGKFSLEDRDMFAKEDCLIRDRNAGLYDVWHVVWRGFARKAIVSFVNEAGLLDQRVELDTYTLNKEAGDISIEYIFEPQVYECVRIGGNIEGIYPYGARAVAFERNGKLPYNGLMELLPSLGKFSVVDIVTPYQVFYNIVAYHREMALAKNKMAILMVARSLLGKKPEDTIYKMLADGVLYIDDEEDQGMLRAQQVRMLVADTSNYIKELGELLTKIRQDAMDQVDMTPQRYGEIATSAGKGTTEEAIARGSMGTVIVEFMMDMVRERDYARDMDFSKLAWIDGLNTAYRDSNKELKYISLNIDNHIYADYVIKAKSSAQEYDKLQQLKQFAFSAAQNGDSKMAIAAITGDNVATISKLIEQFDNEKQQHEMQLKQMDQQLAQMEQEFELQKIAAKGEEDRKTEQLKGYIDEQIELIKADANMISFNAEVGEKNQQAGIDRLNEARADVERQKLQVAREKNFLDAFSKAEDRRVKEKDIEAKIKIAKTNKNRYDTKRK